MAFCIWLVIYIMIALYTLNTTTGAATDTGVAVITA